MCKSSIVLVWPRQTQRARAAPACLRAVPKRAADGGEGGQRPLRAARQVGGGGGRRSGPNRGGDLRYVLTLELEQAVKGCNPKITRREMKDAALIASFGVPTNKKKWKVSKRAWL